MTTIMYLELYDKNIAYQNLWEVIIQRKLTSLNSCGKKKADCELMIQGTKFTSSKRNNRIKTPKG